jgi:peptide/nickel transport system permease protein
VPPSVLLAMLVVAAVLVCTMLGPWIAPDSPVTQRLVLGDTPPSAQHLAGTDSLGRDVVSRVVYGSRTALVGPAVVAVGAFVIATVLGLLAGYLGGAVDTVIMRWADFMLALPASLVAIVVVGVTGGAYWAAALVLVVLFTAPDTRVVRGAVLAQRAMPYIDAARTLGVPTPRILIGHVFPNVRRLVIGYMLLDFAFALVSFAGLSFLGLGVEPGTADWGRMLYENRSVLFTNPMAVLLPAVMIVLTGASINLIGDWLTERSTP